MIEKSKVKTFLSKAQCGKCGAPLENSKLVPISELPFAIIAHAVCANCNGENVVTITSVGAGVLPIVSDMDGTEMKRFINKEKISLEDVLIVHKKLKKKSVCDLMQPKEKN